MVRLSSETHSKLKTFSEKMHNAHVAGIFFLPEDQIDHVSLDYVVQRLLTHFNGHADRVRKSKRKRS